MDVFVWFDDADEIVSYQPTYNNPHEEKALIWSKEKGLTHLGDDDSARPGKHPVSSLFVKDGVVIPSKIVSMLRNDKGYLKPWIENFIADGIKGHFEKNKLIRRTGANGP